MKLHPCFQCGHADPEITVDDDDADAFFVLCPACSTRSYTSTDATWAKEIWNNLCEIELRKGKYEITQDIYWQMMLTLEEKCGHSAGALDAILIRAAYEHWNTITGSKHKPRYISEK